MNRVPSLPSIPRSARLRLLALAPLVAALLAAAPAWAGRVFPAGSLQGDAVFGAFPNLNVNCTSYTLGPGIRVYDVTGRLLLTGQLPGLSGRLVFQRDAYGNVFKAWFVAPGDPSLAPVPVAPGTCLFMR